MVTHAPTAPAGALLAAARALQPRVQELAPEIDRERWLSPELVQAFRDAGLFHMLLPREFGGQQIDPVTAARVVEEIAWADGAAGWCVMIAQQNVAFAGFLGADDVRAIWGAGGIVAGTARAIGRATWTEQPAPGYRVSGRWPFASGSSHATWFAAECVVYDGDTARPDAAGEPVTRMVFVPRAEVTVHDTWHTSGLRGTASHDFSIDGAFVPAARGFQMLVSPPQHPWALYRAPALVFANHGSHALGMARGAIDEARAIVAAKSGYGSPNPMREQPRVQAQIAEATALVESARAYLYAAVGALWAALEAGEADPALPRARTRLATSHAATASVRAVDLACGAVGTAAIFTQNALERRVRDVRAAATHVMVGPLTYEAAGRVELGLPAQVPFF
ncbi:MAG: hydroxylase [Dehalococcoidia bacterium]|nr:hydroxylase [Dehalococcoidia bacterium]